jgi:hypothetical protein
MKTMLAVIALSAYLIAMTGAFAMTVRLPTDQWWSGLVLVVVWMPLAALHFYMVYRMDAGK